jgi:poly-gamma-glutamate capsule biosynthesis protein CapA/YwtB (metallophosphatase superfamily)
VTDKPILSTGSPYTDGPKLDFERDLPMSVSGSFTVAAVGDIVITRPIADLDDPQVQAAIAPLREADLAVGNLEQTIADFRNFDGASYGVASFQIMADPAVAQDLARMGLGVLGRANNRLSDFGVAGDTETDAHLRAAGITPVGYGPHLAAARAPAYCDIRQGRVGAVSFTTHVNHGLEGVFAASARIGQSNGRPGANHLRVERTVRMPERSWTALRDFVVANDYAFPGTFAVVPNIMVYEDRLRIGADWYVPADAPGYSYRENPADLREILRNLRNAALYSNFTVCFMHGHQWAIDPDAPRGGLAGELPEPPDFLTRVARAAIDAGADMFCMTGPFDFKAIEIYRGKPVFYGLGSFARQAYMEEMLPWESYRPHRFGTAVHEGVNPHDTDVTDAELLFGRAPRHPARYFQGATASCRYEDGMLREIRLHPLDLGMDGPASDLGTPRRATGERAREILEGIARNCVPFGTRVEITDGVGVIGVSPSAGE